MSIDNWITTTRHDNRQSLAGREPLGIRHARRSGDANTACGLSAMNWKMFWHLPFGTGPDSACADCLAAVRGTFARHLKRADPVVAS
jgi:hypothetical protein